MANDKDSRDIKTHWVIPNEKSSSREPDKRTERHQNNSDGEVDGRFKTRAADTVKPPPADD